MSGLFEQYNDLEEKYTYLPKISGLIDASEDDDTPIFCRQKIDFSPPEPIQFMCAANNVIVMSLLSSRILRIDLEHPDNPDEIELVHQPGDRLHALHLDPTGKHVIASFESGDNCYIARSSKKARPLVKLKGYVIGVIAWNRSTTTGSSGEILFGTTKGQLISTEITATSEDSRFFQASIEQYVKQLYDFGCEEKRQISGLTFDCVEAKSTMKCYVIVTIEGRIYQFIGSVPKSQEPPILGSIFTKYESETERFLELPGTISNSGELAIYRSDEVKRFAWSTGSGVLFGKLDETVSSIEDSVTVETKLIPYPLGDDIRPVSISLTEFHLLILYEDSLKAISTLNDKIVFEDSIDQMGEKVLGICRDERKSYIWVYTSHSVYKYRLIRESRDVWKTYLAQNEFSVAKKFCNNNKIQLDQVLTKEAEFYFKDEQYTKAAETFALTEHSFEDIALMFMQLPDKNALITFLELKLGQTKSKDKTQITMLVTWIVEIYLYRLGTLKNDDLGNITVQYQCVQREFMTFLASKDAKDCVLQNKAMIYELISSHGLTEELISFAVTQSDYDRIISYYVRLKHWTKALDILSKERNSELIYKFSPSLIQHKSAELMNLWIKFDLDPKLLLNTLVTHLHHNNTKDKPTDTINYLEHSVYTKKVNNEAIHNYLLSLYVKHDPDKLLTYLTLQGKEAEYVPYDIKYALRICSEYKLKRACVFIYSAMGLYQEAVSLALQVDIKLAKEQADLPENDNMLKKKLWLEIAKHVVDKETDIGEAMRLLRECKLLRIDDVLPFFPDFVTIDHFKEAICVTLEEYNNHIEGLKVEMNHAMNAAADIRADIQTFRNDFSCIKVNETCLVCNSILLSASIYIFPCGHRFHSSCLIDKMMTLLSVTKRNLVINLQSKLNIKHNNNHKQLQEELDTIVSSECIYCGDIMIRSTDEPFINNDDYDEIMKTWL